MRIGSAGDTSVMPDSSGPDLFILTRTYYANGVTAGFLFPQHEDCEPDIVFFSISIKAIFLKETGAMISLNAPRRFWLRGDAGLASSRAGC